MIGSLISVLGTSLGGAFFGQITSFIQNRAEAKDKKDQRNHEKFLATGNNIKEYYENMLKAPNKVVLPPTYSRTIFMLTATYCLTVLIFAAFPNEIIQSLNPNVSEREINFFFLFGYKWTPEKMLELTTGGAALMMAYPIIFILSAVLTNTVSKRLH